MLSLPESPLCELWAIPATPTGDCREPAGIRTILSRLRRQLLSERSLFCYRFPKAPFANCGQSTRPRRGIAVNLRGYGQSSVACGDSSFQKGAFFVTASQKPPLERGRSRAPPVADAARRKPNEQGSARKPLLRQRGATFANCGQSPQPRRGIAVNLRGYGQSSVACGDSSFQKGAFFVIASQKPPLERGWQRRRC